MRLLFLDSSPLLEALLLDVRGIFPNAVIRNTFGTTEASGYIFGAYPEAFARASDGRLRGRVVDGPHENLGILRIRSPAVMLGYWNMPDETAKCLSDGPVT